VFGIEWSEYAVIAIVALIVIGPKELPAVLRAIGQWTTKIRRMAAEFQSQFQEALREAEMADLKKEVDNLNETARGFSQFDDPIKDATKWEAKPDGIAKSAEASPSEAPQEESAAVAPVPRSDPPPQAGEAKPAYPPLPASDGTVGEESFPISTEQPTIEETPSVSSPAGSSAKGKGDNGGGAAETSAAPALAQPLSQDSGHKGSEGGVHS
jgi:sec-independent protein translocase protein TatB